MFCGFLKKKKHIWENSRKDGLYRNPSFGLTTKAKGLQGCGVRGSPGVKIKRLQGCRPKRSPGVTSHTPRSVRKFEGV